MTREANLLFTTPTGKPVTSAHWSYFRRGAVKKTGLPKGFGLHGLRHYYGTLLVHAGANVKTVQRAMGHATPTITPNVYTHDWPDALDRPRALVDAAFGNDTSATLAPASGEHS